jgi:hypothetical protein
MDIQVDERAIQHVNGTEVSIRIPLSFYPPGDRTYPIVGAKLTAARLVEQREKPPKPLKFRDLIVISADDAGATVPKMPIEISGNRDGGRNTLWFETTVGEALPDDCLIEVDIQLNFPPSRFVDITVPLEYRRASDRAECGRLRRKTPSTVPILNTIFLYALFGILITWNTQKNVGVHAALFSQQEVAYGIGAVLGFLSLPTFRSLTSLFTVHGLLSLFRFPELIFDRLYLKLVKPRWVLCLNLLLCGSVLYFLLTKFDTIELPKSVSGEVLYDKKLKKDVEGKRIYRKDSQPDRYFYYSGRVSEQTGKLLRVASLDLSKFPPRIPREFQLDDRTGKEGTRYRGSYYLGQAIDKDKADGDYPNSPLISQIYNCLKSKDFRTPSVTYEDDKGMFIWGQQPVVACWEIEGYLERLTNVATQVITDHINSNKSNFHFVNVSSFSSMLEKVKSSALKASGPDFNADKLARVRQAELVCAIAKDLKQFGESRPKIYAAHLYAALALVDLIPLDAEFDSGRDGIRELMKMFQQYAKDGIVAGDQEIFLMFNSLIFRLIRNSESSDLLSEHIAYVNELVSRPSKGIDGVSDYLWTYLDAFESKAYDSFPKWETMTIFFKNRLEKLTDNTVWPGRLAVLTQRFNSGSAKTLVGSLATAFPGPVK